MNVLNTKKEEKRREMYGKYGKENCEQLLVPAADELTPFAASVSPSVRRRASSVHRGQPEAAHAG